MENVLSSIHDILFVISFDHEILFANEQASINFETDLIGKTCYEVLLNKDQPCEICAIAEFNAKDVSRFRFEKEIFLPSVNRECYFDVGSVMIEEFKGVKAIVEVLRDVTTHRKQEREIELLLSSLKDILFVISFDHEILFANDEAVKNFETDLIGKTCYKVLLKKDQPCEICAIVEFKSKGVCNFRFEKEIILPSVKRKCYFDVGSAIIEEYKGVKAIVEVLRDITERKMQERTILQLSTPIIKIWDNILAVPLIGILDSKRATLVTETLLEAIVKTGSKIAIIDVTGITVIDTQVANHLIKTLSAVRLLGAKSIITGIRPEIAQTLVDLGVSLGDIVTSSQLSGGLNYAFKMLGYTISNKE